jgi:hypothetical protein
MRSAAARAACLALLLAVPSAGASAAPPELEIRTALSRWYEELAKKEEGRPLNLTAPGFIDASPHYRHDDRGARKLGPRTYTSLAAQALKFDWEIDSIRADSLFARVRVWERGYFYAFAAQATYERGAAATFLLERGESDGRWLIAAHQSGPQGIPANKITSPMPDLRALYYATEGRDRDPAADARAAAERR